MTTESNVVDLNEDSTSPVDEETQNQYKIWKKNTPFLYDYVVTHSLLWPSMTVQFFPDLERSSHNDTYNEDLNDTSKDFAGDSEDFEYQLLLQRILIGTFTLGQSIDNISLLQLPYYRSLNKHLKADAIDYVQEKQEFQMTKIGKTKIKVLQRINHLGDVNRARYMPQNPNVIASCNNLGDLVVYDRTKQSSFRNNFVGDDVDINTPQFRLINEQELVDVFGLDWNQQKEGVIVSGDMRGSINVYDIKKSFVSKTNPNIRESKKYSTSGAPINDIQWVPYHDSLFVSVDDNGSIKIFDTRCPANSSPVLKKDTNIGMNALSINPSNVAAIGTGNLAGVVDIWDLRNFGALDVPSLLHAKAHVDEITLLKWHPKYHNVIGSSANDKLVKIHDVAKFSEESYGLLFNHGGHMLGVNDFDWSLHEDWLLASVANDNSVHFWKPSNSYVYEYKAT